MMSYGQLGAITGERLEFWLSLAAFRALLGHNAFGAICANSIDHLRGGIDRALKKDPPPKAAKELRDLLDDVQAEEAVLRARGVQGPIPVCLHPTGSQISRQGRYFRRAVPIHERFHATLRRVEFLAGKRVAGCSSQIAAVLGPALHPDLVRYAERWWTGSNPDQAIEEILAYAESLVKLGQRSQRDETNMSNYFLIDFKSSGLSQAGIDSFFGIVQLIRTKYGTAANIVREGLRSCPKP